MAIDALVKGSSSDFSSLSLESGPTRSPFEGEGYTRFKAEKCSKELGAIASKHGLTTAALQTFVDGILDRMIFDGEQLSDLLAPLDLGWRARTQA